MDFTISPAEPGHHQPLGELTAQAYLQDGFLTYGAEDPYLETLRDVSGRAGQAEILVALDQAGALLGGVTFALAGTPLAEICASGEAEFRTLAVGPGARGRGVGEALVRACLDRARQERCTAVALSTQPPMHTAHRLYERLGFVRTPERDWCPVPHVQLLTYRLAL